MEDAVAVHLEALRNAESAAPHFGRVASHRQVAEPDAVTTLCWTARMQAASGNLRACRTTLLAAWRAGEPERAQASQEFLSACMFGFQFDLLRDAAAALFPGLRHMSFGLSRPGDEHCNRFPGVALMEVAASAPSLRLGPSYWLADMHLASTRLMSCLPILEMFVADPRARAGRFHINTTDHGFAPGVASSARLGEFFLVPDPDYLQSKGYAKIRAAFDADRIPYAARKRVAFWRGGSQGHSTSGWSGVPRIRMCLMAQDEPLRGCADVRLSEVYPGAHVTEEDGERIRQLGLVGDFVPPERFQDYAVHVDVDGHSNSWAGLFIKLLSGSPVIKVASEQGFRQWYYGRLEPWWNYVPAAPDLSDLADKVLWLLSNPDEARRIGERGAALARSLDFESQSRAMVDTLLEAAAAEAAG